MWTNYSRCNFPLIHEPRKRVLVHIQHHPDLHAVGNDWPTHTAIPVLPNGPSLGEVGNEVGTEMGVLVVPAPLTDNPQGEYLVADVLDKHDEVVFSLGRNNFVRQYLVSTVLSNLGYQIALYIIFLMQVFVVLVHCDYHLLPKNCPFVKRINILARIRNCCIPFGDFLYSALKSV
jgi:hypothetical protein